MTTSVSSSITNTPIADEPNSKTGFDLERMSKTMLSGAAKFWFLATVIGQWVFVYYVVFFYGGAVIDGNLETWNKVLPNGYVKGETMGNLAVGIHMLFAAIIMLGGPLQLVPKVRAKFPRFHRINGRIYLLTAVVCALTGLYMNAQQKEGSLLAIENMGMTLNTVFVVVFAALAIRYAMVGKIAIHRRWALRLFMVVSGVWFFRIGIMLWVSLVGPVGFDPKTFTGPAITSLNFAQTLFPLAVLELYFFAQKSRSAASKFTMATTLIVLTGFMGFGLFIAFMGMWLPRL